MLNRRNAILAASGSMFLTGRNTANASSNDYNVGRSVTIDNQSVMSPDIQLVADACLECAAACSDVIGQVSNSADLAADCKDICTVTATISARGGHLSPAICQSCADACYRLVVTCDGPATSPLMRICCDAALNCAKVCNLHVSRVS